MMRMLTHTLLTWLILGAAAPTVSAQTSCGEPVKTKASAGCLVEQASFSAKARSLQRAPSFVASYREATRSGAPTLILLHGSGGNETSLMDLAAKAAPGAALLGIRGRVVQDGVNRWYKRITPTRFDQKDILAEADAFAAFMKAAQKQYDIDPSNAIYLGYSNGANLLAALSLLHPDLVQRAALLRPMMVLQTLPSADLADDKILAVAGKNDVTYGSFAPGLAKVLRAKGAKVAGQTVELGHLLGEADVVAVRKWLEIVSPSDNAAALATLSASANQRR